MSEVKLTKGLWEARGRTPSRIYGMMREDKEVLVATTGSVSHQSGANAHLIAAAPEMYDLLLRASKQLDKMNEGYNADIAADEIIIEAKIALAKARGEL